MSRASAFDFLALIQVLTGLIVGSKFVAFKALTVVADHVVDTSLSTIMKCLVKALVNFTFLRFIRPVPTVIGCITEQGLLDTLEMGWRRVFTDKRIFRTGWFLLWFRRTILFVRLVYAVDLAITQPIHT